MSQRPITRPEDSDPRIGPLLPSPGRYLLGYAILFGGVVVFAVALGVVAWLLR